MYYRKCVLEKGDNRVFCDVPEREAVAGRTIRLFTESGEWTDWRVKEVWPAKMAEPQNRLLRRLEGVLAR